MPRGKRVVQTSGVVESETRKATVSLADPKAILERFKDYPAIDVISRRFANPADPGSLPILLKDEDANCCVNSEHANRLREGAVTCHLCKKPARKWFVYWFNLAREGRNAQMRAKGFVAVEIKELADANDISDLFKSKEDGYVRRGDRGQEILGKMPLELYNAVKARQRATWTKSAVSAKKLRADLAEAAGNELGDEAGQSIHEGGIKIESLKQSRTTLGDEADFDGGDDE